jgi:peptide-methionine (S)-S-oxide reductase
MKNIMKIKPIIYVIVIAALFSCKNQAQENSKLQAIKNAEPVEVPLENGKARAYFASGCFWCVEAIYESVKGVEEVINGYAGGFTKKISYELSNTGKTGHAEAVEVIYDPNVISFSDLVDVYFGSQNVTQINGQGPDIGSQYRSILFYQNDDQKAIIIDKIKEIQKRLEYKVAAEVYPFLKFHVGEDYHQNFERLNPNHPYIRNISIPRLKRFQAKFPHLLKEKH